MTTKGLKKGIKKRVSRRKMFFTAGTIYIIKYIETMTLREDVRTGSLRKKKTLRSIRNNVRQYLNPRH